MKSLKVALATLLLFASQTLFAATGIIPLEDYLYGVEKASLKDYLDLKGTEVNDERSFDEMKKHILEHYQGVLVTNSFLGDSGKIIDCVITESQPSLQTEKMRDHKIAKPPEVMLGSNVKIRIDEQKEDILAPQLGKNKIDRFNNLMYCDTGTIPLTRLMLATLVHYPSLSDFFYKKPPVDKGEEPVPGDDTYTHYWAHAKQTVNNYGGDSRLNVWKPNADPGWFSLSQHWYVGGSGSGRQTVEGGWQVAWRKYDTTNPHLFIYSTSANYASGSGCYNLDCAAFVQINNSWVIGGQLGPVSTMNGTQYIFRMQWQYYEGNWWLFLKGRGAADPGVEDYYAIGYYPEEHFDGGQMTHYATKIDYGGEVSSLLGDNKTGEMGSGKFASEGWKRAAYQRTIYYIDTSHVSHWANLSKVNNTPSCYTADVHNLTGGTWATYLYFGGEKCPNP